jgi:hypothetical protein
MEVDIEFTTTRLIDSKAGHYLSLRTPTFSYPWIKSNYYKMNILNKVPHTLLKLETD